jgi:ubiquinone/menaquinone biosynthesis C-methylase UbiE
MSNWTDGYVSEIDYTHGFYRELTPSFLAFCMLLKGIRPPSLSSSFAYCELGFGQGFSANLIAAANPQGDIWATDFNPSHAAGAQQLAVSAGTPNVRFFDKSFAELLETDTPPFDFIVLHGIYSWISPENRRTIREIVRRKLKFGGVVYISYNCLPGWSPAMPLRQLMIEHAAGSTEPMVSRIDKAIAFAQQLSDLKAGYFGVNPGVVPRLERLKGMSRNYLAHEYFNQDWQPQYFAEVARELAEAKLTFAASANPADHVDQVNLTADAQRVLAEIGDPLFRETVRDYFLNQQFRKDVFVKGSVKLTPQEQTELLLATRFTLTAPRASIPLKASFALGEVTLHEETYVPVLDALGKKGPATLGQLLAIDGVREVGLARLVQAVTVLAATGHVAPCLPAGGEDDRRDQTQGFNAAVMDRARFSDQLAFLASPVTGGGMAINRFDQLFLLAAKQDANPAEAVWQVLAAQNQRLIKDGKTIESTEGNLTELRARAETFMAQTLPVLKQLGIG